MLVRPQMHDNIKALISAIDAQNSQDAIALIRQMHRHTPGLLTIVDENNVNLLEFALHCELRAVAMALLKTDEFDSEEGILFKTGQTPELLCLAAKLSYEEVAEEWHVRANKRYHDLPQEQQLRFRHSGFKADSSGNTALHYACKHRNVLLYSFLFQLPGTKGVINSTNVDGDTPLHLALENSTVPHMHLIHALLDAGADLDVANKEGITPFDLLLRCPADRQLAFLHGMDDRRKPNRQPREPVETPSNPIDRKPRRRIFANHDNNTNLLLEHYHDYLAQHPEMVQAYLEADAAQRKQHYPIPYVYFTYMSQQGLAERTIAALELDPRVVLTDHYKSRVRKDGFLLKIMTQQIPSAKRIVNDIKSKNDVLYLYRLNDRFFFASRDNDAIVQRIDITEYLKTENYLPIMEVFDKGGELKTPEMEALADIAQFYGYTLLIPPCTKLVINSIENTAIEEPELATRLPAFNSKLLAKRGFFAFTSNPAVLTGYLLRKDLAILDNLIHRFDQALQDWSARKPRPFYKWVALLPPLFYWATYLATEIYLVKTAIDISNEAPLPGSYFKGEKIVGPDDPHPDTDHLECHHDFEYDEPLDRVYSHYHDPLNNKKWIFGGVLGKCEKSTDAKDQLYNWLSAGIALGGAALGIAHHVLMHRRFWHKEDVLTIAKKESQPLLVSLTAVLGDLTALTPETRTKIKDNHRDLIAGATVLLADQPQENAVAALQRILVALRQIRSEIKTSGIPFSQLPSTTETVINIDRAVTEIVEDDEAQPLLSARV